MTYEQAKLGCAVREAIFRKSIGVRYYKNHPISLDGRVPVGDKAATDWEIYDPRDDDNCSLFMYND